MFRKHVLGFTRLSVPMPMKWGAPWRKSSATASVFYL